MIRPFLSSGKELQTANTDIPRMITMVAGIRQGDSQIICHNAESGESGVLLEVAAFCLGLISEAGSSCLGLISGCVGSSCLGVLLILDLSVLSEAGGK